MKTQLKTDLFKEHTEHWENLATVDKVSLIAGSVECFSFAISAFQTCLQQHSGCRISSPNYSPTRLLYFNANKEDPFVRLVEPTPGATHLYTALSHCWGGSQILSTAHKTLTESMTAIDWEALPRTFQDGFTVGRQLGIHYLWIDSLCIL
ncbi:hypothetical protein M501DRAFT_764123 [Patellaria atrata CBS 101060]|uniref:Heterokaryon incompatibility domain-containing protein n=1 Tax=Patellaria atrata CBS 101060 TaxID=1346257 RepID=A0A9P4VMW8_9PEZI|nr:hypothetical protein M501DRAFT_764123 [Patellaria atrata CBS 101060]